MGPRGGSREVVGLRCGCSLSIVRLRPLLQLGPVLLIAGCGLGPRVPVDDDVPMGDQACRSEHYLFAGRGTLADLGLVGQSVTPLPEPARPAMIWVTEDHTLCFEFNDGSGGSDWPIEEAWLPPVPLAAAATASGPLNVILIVLVGVVTAVLAVGSLLAFRRR